MEREERLEPDPRPREARAFRELRGRSRLKIFFGYAPGVGKSYTMIESARRAKAEGVDVVVGVVETHNRPETAALLEGLELLPRRQVAYRGITLGELDLDAALARRPALILVDELAHTNAPGSRHAKRWQDVEELLAAGSDVYTTLNVQHLETLNDVVAQITGVRVRETVPDALLERADELELVDLTPEELLNRLREGKVYLPEEAQLAADRFFRKGNLLALRELALRRAAERVDTEVRAYRDRHAIRTTWPAAERILVGVGPSPSSARLIRSACRMAAGLGAAWIAAYVEAPDAPPPARADNERLQAHLRLAESLGAEVVRLSGRPVGQTLLGYCRDHNVTRIVVGKPTHGRWRDLFRGSLVDGIVRGSGEIEVHVVADGEERPGPAAERRTAAVGRWLDYFLALLLVGVATAVAAAVRTYLSLPDIVMLYLLVIMVAAFRFDRGPSLAAAGLSVAVYDFFFVPPYHTFSVGDTRHFLTFAVMFAVGIAISSLTSRLRRQERGARLREERTAALYGLSRELLPVLDDRQAARIASRQAARVFGGGAAVLLRGPSGALSVAGCSDEAFRLREEDLAVARWVGEHGQAAGPGTDTLPGARLTCLPLVAGPTPLGVLALRPQSFDMLDIEHRHFLDAFLRQVSLALERARLGEEARAAALRARSEEMRSSLLSAVSHDLRTPLAAILGAGTALRDDPGRLDGPQRAVLLDTLCAEAESMERLVGNLLDMVRLESGGIAPKVDWIPLEEVLGSALVRLEARLEGRDLRLDVPEDLPLLSVDPVLFPQVFVNLLDNALKYAPGEGPIEIRARAEGEAVEIEVADRGPGLPAGDDERVFEKFYRGSHTGAAGTGLGLSICRGIVQAHGGTITAGNRAGGGAAFRIRLPFIGRPPAMPEAPGLPAGNGGSQP